MERRLILLLMWCVLSPAIAGAQQKSDHLRPRWLTSSLPHNLSPSYTFMDASGTGNTLEEARQHSFVNLSSKLEHERGIKVSSSVKVNSNTARENGRYDRQSRQSFQMECIENGKEITMTTRIVDEYWERHANVYVCHVLYTITDNNSPAGSYDDDIRLTTSYGAKGFFYSLIPGAGQLYKGSKLKGSLILGGTAACAGMIVIAENLRSSYVKKMKEKPQDMEFYNNKAGDWQNIRNGFIGAAAALYVYNLIDAAVAPGRRHVTVKKRQHTHFSLIPAWNAGHGGMSLVMNF